MSTVTTDSEPMAFLTVPALGVFKLRAGDGILVWDTDKPENLDLANRLVPLNEIPRSGGNPVAWAIHRLKEYLGGFSRVLITPDDSDQ